MLMKKRLMIATFSLTFIISMVSSEVLSEDPEDKDITDIYYNILIGELLPSGNVYWRGFH